MVLLCFDGVNGGQMAWPGGFNCVLNKPQRQFTVTDKALPAGLG